jgi:hypothetical protein
MQFEWHPRDLEVETSLLTQTVDETFADVAKRSYIIKEHLDLDHVASPPVGDVGSMADANLADDPLPGSCHPTLIGGWCGRRCCVRGDRL